LQTNASPAHSDIKAAGDRLSRQVTYAASDTDGYPDVPNADQKQTTNAIDAVD
jgi:hypothetical protein